MLYIHKEFLPIVSELKRNVMGLRHIILAEDIQEAEGEKNEDVFLYDELINTLPEEEEIVYLHAAPMFHLADGAQTFIFVFAGDTHVIIRSTTPIEAANMLR